jgi:ectoine hydroxylase-related dioxygenase (phytanoyl-CoA dioxygenase family)
VKMRGVPQGNVEAKHLPTQENLDVSAPWDEDNQAWWDWYVGLAHNPPMIAHRDRRGPAHRVERAAMDVALEPNPRTVAPLRFDALARELSTPYIVSAETITRFRAEGYVKLSDVLSPGAVVALRREFVAVLETTFGVALDGGSASPSRNQTDPGPELGRRFYSAEMIWLENPIFRLFVLSPRIAKICSDLLGVDSVRLYHDNLLSKEPGCGRTPWHYDDHHFPLKTNDVVTAWIAAQAIPEAMGPLAFARGMETWRLVADVPFSKVDNSYDRRIADAFDRADVDVDNSPFAVGDVSFHHNLSFHTAGANATSISRCALANTFFADGARVVDAPTMVSGNWRKFLPGVEPGGAAASPLNPICWPAPEDWAHSEQGHRKDNG